MSAARSPNPVLDQAYRSLEWRLTDPLAFGLTTASPLQRAICRVADGFPLEELAEDLAVSRALGGSSPPPTKPREIAILSGVRCGKSLIAACASAHMSQTCDVSRLGPGEIPRVSVVSTSKDNADVILAHLVGRLGDSPILKHLVMGDPTSDSVMVRHPSGRLVEIKVVAGSRAGYTLVSRWSAGAIFDEFPRMVGSGEYVVNWDDCRNAVVARLLKGAQIWHIGSPWMPDGPAYEMVTKHHGRPTKNLVVIVAPAPAMNPVVWTEEEQEKVRAADPEVYRTDVLAEFATPEEAMFPADVVRAAIRAEAKPEPGLTYVAAMDPATRGNGWTLGVFTRQDKRRRMVLAREWRGTRDEPLSPLDVLQDIAAVLKPYGVTTVDTDQYYIDALIDIARRCGLRLSQVSLTAQEKTERYQGIKARLVAGEMEIVEDVRSDLVRLRKRVTASGVHVVLPVSPDGRHCDYAPVVMLGLGRWIKDEAPPVKKADPEEKRMLELAQKRYAKPKDSEVW